MYALKDIFSSYMNTVFNEFLFLFGKLRMLHKLSTLFAFKPLITTRKNSLWRHLIFL